MPKTCQATADVQAAERGVSLGCGVNMTADAIQRQALFAAGLLASMFFGREAPSSAAVAVPFCQPLLEAELVQAHPAPSVLRATRYGSETAVARASQHGTMRLTARPATKSYG